MGIDILSKDLRYYRRHLEPYYLRRGAPTLPEDQGPAVSLNDELLAPMAAGIVAQIDFSGPEGRVGGDPLLAMFATRSHFATAQVESVVRDIQDRYRLMRDNLTGLDYAICKTDGMIMELPEFQLGCSKDLDRIRTNLELEVLKLEEQKRDEYLGAWKDISRVKRDLFESLNSYLDAKGSTQFLGNYGGGQY